MRKEEGLEDLSCTLAIIGGIMAGFFLFVTLIPGIGVLLLREFPEHYQETSCISIYINETQHRIGEYTCGCFDDEGICWSCCRTCYRDEWRQIVNISIRTGDTEDSIYNVTVNKDWYLSRGSAEQFGEDHPLGEFYGCWYDTRHMSRIISNDVDESDADEDILDDDRYQGHLSSWRRNYIAMWVLLGLAFCGLILLLISLICYLASRILKYRREKQEIEMREV